MLRNQLFTKKKASQIGMLKSLESGAGGSRTLVQTGKPYAFYTLILDFIFVLQQDPSHQLQPYPLNLHHAIEA